MPTQATTPCLAKSLVEEATEGSCLTIGLVGGAREPSERLTVNSLVAKIAGLVQARRDLKGVLAIRLVPESADEQDDTTFTRMPVAQTSPLGPWSEVTLPASIGRTKSLAERNLSSWLPVWKDAFGVILMDLGPINRVATRHAGRLCDGVYLVLGPSSCGSQDWIMEQVAWHSQAGSTVCGTVVTDLAKAA